MKCINFDERFADFTAKWMKEHRGEYKTYDEMEDDLPRVYTEFLNMPAKWLDGVTPGAYFFCAKARWGRAARPVAAVAETMSVRRFMVSPKRGGGNGNDGTG